MKHHILGTESEVPVVLGQWY